MCFVYILLQSLCAFSKCHLNYVTQRGRITERLHCCNRSELCWISTRGPSLSLSHLLPSEQKMSLPFLSFDCYILCVHSSDDIG